MKSLTPIGLLFLSLLLPAVLQAQPGGGPALVRVAEARLQALAPVTLVPGTVISRSDARLSAEVEGRLERVAEVGDIVVVGDVLAVIDDATLRLRNAELQAELRRTEASLRFLDGELERFTKLAQSNLAAVTQLDQTRSERDMALGDKNIAQARLAQNQDLLDKTRILAPFSGVVVERLMTPGERVTEGSMVVRLIDQARLEVIARAPLEYFSFVQRNQLLEIRSGSQVAQAEVRTVVAVGDENTHQFELRLDLQGEPFPAGLTVRVAIPTAATREVLAVPRDALVLRADGSSVFIIDTNGQAKQVSVTTGVGSGDQIEVFGDVSPGDQVVIRGNERLQPGQAVQIMEG